MATTPATVNTNQETMNVTDNVMQAHEGAKNYVRTNPHHGAYAMYLCVVLVLVIVGLVYYYRMYLCCTDKRCPETMSQYHDSLELGGHTSRANYLGGNMPLWYKGNGHAGNFGTVHTDHVAGSDYRSHGNYPYHFHSDKPALNF